MWARRWRSKQKDRQQQSSLFLTVIVYCGSGDFSDGPGLKNHYEEIVVVTCEESKTRSLSKSQDARPLLEEPKPGSENTVALTLPRNLHCLWRCIILNSFKYLFSHSFHNSESHILEGVLCTAPTIPSLPSVVWHCCLALLLGTAAVYSEYRQRGHYGFNRFEDEKGHDLD